MTDQEPQRWVFRANRSFGAIEENELLTFAEDGDPVMKSLVGAGYLDLVSGPPVQGIPSAEKVGHATLGQQEVSDE